MLYPAGQREKGSKPLRGITTTVTRKPLDTPPYRCRVLARRRLSASDPEPRSPARRCRGSSWSTQPSRTSRRMTRACAGEELPQPLSFQQHSRLRNGDEALRRLRISTMGLATGYLWWNGALAERAIFDGDGRQ